MTGEFRRTAATGETSFLSVERKLTLSTLAFSSLLASFLLLVWFFQSFWLDRIAPCQPPSVRPSVRGATKAGGGRGREERAHLLRLRRPQRLRISPRRRMRSSSSVVSRRPLLQLLLLCSFSRPVRPSPLSIALSGRRPRTRPRFLSSLSLKTAN